MTQHVRITNLAIQGERIDGVYPVTSVTSDSVVVRHPTHGLVKVSRRFASLPDSDSVFLTYEELLEDIEQRFHTFEYLLNGVIQRRFRALYVSSAPGVGKSHTFRDKLDKAQEQGTVSKYKVVTGAISPPGLYCLLHEYRHPGCVLVIDDADSIFFDEEGVSILKAATDSGKHRIVSWQKMSRMMEDNGIPLCFEFEGAVCVATNIDFEREIKSKSKIAEHLSAIINRSLYLDLGLRSKQALMARTEQVCRNTDMLREIGANDEQIETVIRWLKDNQMNLKNLSNRTAILLTGIILSAESDEWKRVAKDVLLKVSGR